MEENTNDENILDEFNKSGLSVDEFILKMFKEQNIENPEEQLAKINSTFQAIDKKYDELVEHKKNGGTRDSFLKGIVDNIASTADKKNVGKVLSDFVSVLKNEQPKADDQIPSYEGFDEMTHIQELSEAIKVDVLGNYFE